MSSSHIKSTFKHAIIYSASGIAAKAVGFFMLPVYAHYLRGEGYGILGMIDVVLGLVTVLIGHGIQSAMSKFYYESTDPHYRNCLISTSIMLMIVLVLTVSSPILISSEKVGRLAFGKEGTGYYIFLATLSFIANMTSKSAEGYILVNQKSVLYSVFSVLRLVMGISLNIYLIVFLQMGLLGYLYSGLATAFTFSILLHAYAFSNVGLHFDKSVAMKVAKFGAPMIPASVATFVKNNADRVILRSSLGLTQLGAFEMLFKFATLIGVLISEPFGKIWGVKRFEIAEEDKVNGPKEIARIFTLEIAILLLAWMILALEIPLLLKILMPHEFWLGGLEAALAVLSQMLMPCYFQFIFGLLFAKKTHKIAVIRWTGTAISIGANLALIPSFGIRGAVIAACVSNVVLCVLGYLLGQRCYFVPYEWGKMVKMAGIALLLFLILNQVSMADLGMSSWVNEKVTPALGELLRLLRFNLIKNGKLLARILSNVPLILEGGIKLVLSLFFIPGLVILGIIPRAFVSKVFSLQTLKNPARMFSEA